MTVQESIDSLIGKTVGFPEGRFVGECLSLVKVHMQNVYGFYSPASGCNGARCYWSKFPSPLPEYFDKVPNTKEFTPRLGDIMVWNENAGKGYGHIAICTGKNTGTQYFESLDQNWNGRQAHLVNHTYQNVYGVLRPKGDSMPSDDEMVLKKSVFEELVTKASKYDAFKSAGYENAEKLINKLDELKESAKQDRETKLNIELELKTLRAEYIEFKNTLGDDNHLMTTRDNTALLLAASTFGTLKGNWEDLQAKYQNDKEVWGDKKSELETEITRLKAMLEYEEVLSNASLEELIRELVKKLTNILRSK